MTRSPRKQRTSGIQDHPAQPIKRPAGSARPRRLDPQGRKQVVLAKGLRLRDSETKLEVVYGAWRWTSRVVVGVAITTGAVTFALGFLAAAPR